MAFFIKRYEICLNPQLTLNPAFFNENNWEKRRFISEIVPLMPQMQALIVASAIVDNVTFQAYSFQTEQARRDFLQTREGWIREFNFLCRRALLANETVNLTFDYEENADGEITPNIVEIKKGRFNPMLGAFSIAQNADLLANALKLNF